MSSSPWADQVHSSCKWGISMELERILATHGDKTLDSYYLKVQEQNDK